MKCPNINDPSYKESVESIGKENTYRLFSLTGGFNNKVESTDSPNIAIQKLKIRFNANEFGFMKSIVYTSLLNEVNKYNAGNKKINLFQASSGDYYLKINKGNKQSINEDILDKTPTIENTIEKVNNTQKSNYAIHKLGLEQPFRENHSHVNFVLNKIINQAEVPSQYKNLAQWLKKLPNEYKNVKLEVVSNLKINKKYNGQYLIDSQKIQLDNSLSQEKLVVTFLHELLHHFTYNTIEHPDSKSSKIVNQISNLRLSAKLNYEEKLGVSLNQETISNDRTLRQFYGLVDNHEFISELFTNPDFQRVLANAEFSENKSFWEKLLELFQDLLETITGISFEDSALVKQSLGNAIRLIENITSPPIGEEIESELSLPSLSEQKKEINEFRKKLTKRKDKVEQDLLKEKNSKRKEDLQDRLNVLESQLEELINLDNYDTIIKIAKENLDYVQKLMSRDKISESDILEIQNFTVLYKNVTDYLNEDLKYTEDVNDEGDLVTLKTSLYNKFEKIEAKAKEIDKKIFDIESKYIQDLYFNLFNKPATKEEIFKLANDASYFDSNFRSAGAFGVKLLEIKETLNKIANNKANEVRNELVSENTELFNKVKENSLFQTKGFDVFKQLDEKGNWNGNKINKFKPEYWKNSFKEWKNIKKILKKDKKLKSEVSQIHDFFNWYRENHFVIDYNQINNSDYQSLIINRFGQFHGMNLINQSISKLEAYQMAHQDYISYLNEQFNDPVTIDRKLQNWEVSNSPFRFLETVNGNYQLTSFGNFPKNYNLNYVTSTPLEQHFDENYSLLEQPENEILLQYLDFVDNTMNKLISVLPDKTIYSKGLSRNFLPIVGKDLIQKYANEGTLSGLTSSFEDWMKELVSHNSISQTEEKDEYTGREDFQLNIKGLDPIKKYDVNSKQYIIDRNAQSDNIFELMNYAIGNYALYDNKSSIEDSYKMISRAFNRIGIEEFGHNANQNELKNIKSVNEFYDKVYYGKATEIGGETSWKTYTKEEKKQNREIENRLIDVLDILDIKLENSIKTKEGISELENIIAELKIQANEIEDDQLRNNRITLLSEITKLLQAKSQLGTNISGGKTGRTVLKWIQTKAMGFNLFSGVNELIFGAISTFNYSTGKEMFTPKDWSKAFGTMLRFRDSEQGAKKVWSLLQKFGLIENTMLEHRSSDNKITNALYYVQSKAEAFSRGLTMVSVLNNIKIKDISGNEVSLFDVLDENGNINKELVSEEDYNKWSKENKVNEFDKLKIKLQALTSQIHGNYDVDTPIKAKNHFIGLAMLQFRTWILEGIAARGQEEHFDSRLGINVKGRYRTMNNSKAWKALALYMLNGFKDSQLEDFSDVDKANIRKNATEIAFAISLYLMLLGFKALKDEDDDESVLQYAGNLLFNVGLRLQSDIQFYIDPQEIEKLNSKIIPATQLLDDIYDFKNAAIDQVFGEPLIKSGVYSGHNKLLKETAQFFPITNQIYKYMFLANQTIDEISNK